MRHQRLAAGEFEGVQKLGTAKRLAHNARLYWRIVIVHDVVCPQQHVAHPASVGVWQGAFFQIGQIAQGGVHHHASAALLNLCRRKNAMANKVGNKTRGRAVVQRISIVPLVQVALVHDANAVANGEGFQLVVRNKQRGGTCSF